MKNSISEPVRNQVLQSDYDRLIACWTGPWGNTAPTKADKVSLKVYKDNIYFIAEYGTRMKAAKATDQEKRRN